MRKIFISASKEDEIAETLYELPLPFADDKLHLQKKKERLSKILFKP